MAISPEEQYVVEVNFSIHKDADGFPRSRDIEALLCKPLDPNCGRCVIASVPFYLRDVAYGDTITTVDRPEGLQFGSVEKRGGYSIYRILLHDLSMLEHLVQKLAEFDVVWERDGNLIALAVPAGRNSDALIDYILEGKEGGLWGAQDGFIFEG